ncbi:MAG: hypothetical protein JW797_13435 [Bradymonadales bacterium]|nr:hypothetical protein [Bradymonadales bacterium]
MKQTVPGSQVFSEWYPPDYDHGGKPLLGDNPATWHQLLEDVVFLNATCSPAGQVVLLMGRIDGGFVEIRGQYLKQGQPLDPEIVRCIRDARFRIPVSGDASSILGLDIEIEQPCQYFDWKATARRMELDLLSTISRIASSPSPDKYTGQAPPLIEDRPVSGR